MKKIIPFILTLIISSCATTYKVSSKSYAYNNAVTFSIDKIQEGQMIKTGTGSYSPGKGNKFVYVYITFQNNLNKKQNLNFNNFSILNKRTKTKHKLQWVMLNSPVNIWSKKDSYINKEDKKKRMLVFTLPIQDKVEFLMVKDSEIEIEYFKKQQ